jgi:hypothetical protein
MAYQAMRCQTRLIVLWESARPGTKRQQRIGRILILSTRRVARRLNQVQQMHEKEQYL